MPTKLALTSIVISASIRDVFRFVAEMRNMPRWAPAFAPRVEQCADGSWDIVREEERIPIRQVRSRRLGVVDFVRKPDEAAARGAFVRMIALSADECAVVMAVPVANGQDSERLQQSIEEELAALREILSPKAVRSMRPNC